MITVPSIWCDRFGFCFNSGRHRKHTPQNFHLGACYKRTGEGLVILRSHKLFYGRPHKSIRLKRTSAPTSACYNWKSRYQPWRRWPGEKTKGIFVGSLESYYSSDISMLIRWYHLLSKRSARFLTFGRLSRERCLSLDLIKFTKSMLLVV